MSRPFRPILRRVAAGASFALIAASIAVVTSTAHPRPALASTPGRVASPRGYWLAAADGGLFTYGDAPYLGSMGGSHLNRPIVGMAPTHRRGYWMVATDGGIFAFGDARFAGSTGGMHLNQPILGMAPTTTDQGYWLAAADGGMFAFGDAPYLGSMGGSHLNRPIVGMAPTPTGRGYWLVASDGGIFNFGDAPFAGSCGSLKLNKPIVAMAATPSGRGYWLVASDGGIFNFGDAPFYGSAASVPLRSPIVAMATTPSGNGYWLVAADGGIFSYGDATFNGSAGDVRLNSPVVTMAAVPARHGTEVVAFYYPWYENNETDGTWGSHWTQNGHNPPDDIASNYYPVRGPYSSADPTVLDAQFAEIAAAGIDEVVVSWWGEGSLEDKNLPKVKQAADAHGVKVGIHIETYANRTAATVGADITRLYQQGYRDFWIYFTNNMPADQLAAVNDSLGPDVRTWATQNDRISMRDGALQDFARAAHFTGVYTYDPYFYDGPDFSLVCGLARQRSLACAAGVAPGFIATRATQVTRVKERANGATYDQRWNGALNAGADVVGIVSYNEWHEGSQIEATQPAGCIFGQYCYAGFDGAYGRSGVDSSTAYLERTRTWRDAYKQTGG